MIRTWIRVLLYADDGVLVASSVKELQHMLDALERYCSKWRLVVNVGKTEGMVFNHSTCKSKWEKERPVVYYNQVPLRIVEEFKYLGIMFHSTQKTYQTMIQYRLQQAKKMVGVWMRTCEFWLFPVDVVINQFMTCILPVMEYGVGIWGVGDHGSGVWKDVECFWRSIARMILGVPSRTPVAAVQGELSWYPFWVRAAGQAVSYWTRVTELSDDALVRKAMHVQRKLVQNDAPCWLRDLRDTLCLVEPGRALWNTWMARDGFKCTCCYEVPYGHGMNKMIIRRWEDDVVDAMSARFVEEWKKDVQRTCAVQGTDTGGNKLRTYARFKGTWRLEPYLINTDCRGRRVLESKFRAGVSQLRIETGRYECVNGKRGLPADQRVCKCCGDGIVEDEEHFMMTCPLYSSLRTQMLDVVRGVCKGGNKKIKPTEDGVLQGVTNTGVFECIMSSNNPSIMHARSTYIWEAFQMRATHLCKP